jgi:integral membrane sensor domain MASE1
MRSDFVRKKNQGNSRRAIHYFVVMSILCFLSVIAFSSSLFINGPKGTYLEKLYQQIILFVLALEELWAIIMPLVFESIKRLKFTKKQIQQAKDESTKKKSTIVQTSKSMSS